MPVRRTTIRVADPVPALQALARVRRWDSVERANGVNKLALDILGAVTIAEFKVAYLRLMAGGNGDGASDRDAQRFGSLHTRRLRTVGSRRRRSGPVRAPHPFWPNNWENDLVVVVRWIGGGDALDRFLGQVVSAAR